MSKYCPECGKPSPYASAKFCPNCGTRLDATKGGKKKDTAPVKPSVDKRDPSATEPVGTPIFPGTSEDDTLDKDTLTVKPKEELIDIILGQEVIARKATEEISFDVSKIPFRAAFDQDVDTRIKKFVRLPIGPTKQHDQEDFATWRVTLVSAHPDQKLLALEVHDDVVVGRTGSGIKPDLDLTRYGGGILGVSRRHALLRPSSDGLQLIDLGSTNGTFCNGSRISAGIGCTLEESSVISFAGVHFLVYALGKV